MSAPNGKKNIVRLRTFADDAERAREATGSTEHVDAEISPEDMAPEDKSVFHKVKKKDLQLKDDEATPSAIDAVGVSFDKKTATKVVDQTYEEGRAVKASTQETHVENIPKIVPKPPKMESAIPPKAPTPAKPTSIPPKAPQKVEAQPEEIAKAAEHFEESAEDTTTPTDGLSQGEFVRDTKRDRFKLVPAIGEAMTSWFVDTKEQIEEAGREKHTVSKTENRVDTIKKAALPETATPDADFAQVAERLKKAKRSTIDTPVVIKPKEKDAPAQWSHLTSEESGGVAASETNVPTTTEITEELVPETSGTVEVAEPKEIEIEETVHVPTEPASEVAPIPKPVTEIAPVTEALAAQQPAVETELTSVIQEPAFKSAQDEISSTERYLQEQTESAPVIDTMPAAESIKPAEVATPTTPQQAPEVQTPTVEPVAVTSEPETPLAPQPIAETVPTTETSAVQQPTIEAAPTEPAETPVLTTSQVKTSKQMRELLPSPVLAIIVVVLAVIAGVGTSMYFFWQPEEGAVTIAEEQVTTKPLFTAQLQTSIPYSDSHTETMSTMLAAINSDPSTLYLYLVDPTTEEPLTPSEVMTHMAPQAPGAFARSINNISFGALNNRPFIILRTNNFDAAFSGMIAWEQTMSTDLAPLFGSAVTRTYDPQARTDDQTRNAFFKDVVSNNLSARLLSDEVGKDRIMYTFVNKQTIVITTDRLQLNEIIPLIR
jgi:hypothetical protein